MLLKTHNRHQSHVTYITTILKIESENWGEKARNEIEHNFETDNPVG